MLIDFYKQYAKLINSIVIVLFLGLIAWLVYYFVFSFHITSITPNPSNASYLTPKLEVKFNRDLTTEELKVEGEGVEVTSRISDTRTLEINIVSKRTIGENYKIKIVYLKSSEGDEFKNHTINLAAVSSEASLTNSDREVILNNQQENKPDVLNDPISELIPYSTIQYAVDPTGRVSPDGKIIISITIFLSNADVKIDRQGAIDSAKQSALNFLRNGVVLEASATQGVNPDNYVIEYEIREP